MPRSCGPIARRRRPSRNGVARRRERSGALCRYARAGKSRGGRDLKSQAVLFRASHHSAALELELTRRNIPFVKYGGLKFLDAAHIKDALALLRFAENPRDRVAGFRVAQLLPGIGPASAEKIVAAAGGETRFAALRAYQPPPRRRARHTPNSSTFWNACAPARPGRRTSAKRSRGGARILEEFYDNVVFARRPTSTRWSASPRPILRASASSASSRSIRPTRPATRRGRRCATRTI